MTNGIEVAQEEEFAETNTLTCSICLDNVDNLSFLDICFHHFCYICILQWSEMNQTCPLCKSQFKSLIYDVKSNIDYKRYVLTPLKKTTTTTTTTTNSNRNVNFYRNSIQQGTISSSYHFVPNPRFNNSDIHSFRKSIYSKNIKAIPMVPNFRFQISPESFTNSFSLWKKKLSPWLQRELQAVLQSENTSILEDLILNLLKIRSIKDQILIETLSKYLFNKTELFLHELLCFAVSPYNIETYDRLVTYQQPIISSSTNLSDNSNNNNKLLPISQIIKNSGVITTIPNALNNIIQIEDTDSSNNNNNSNNNLFKELPPIILELLNTKEPNWEILKNQSQKELEEIVIKLTMTKIKLKDFKRI